MEATTPSVSELAIELGLNAKAVRAWMRQQGWRHPVELGSPWKLSAEQVEQVRAHFSSSTTADRSAVVDDETGLRELTVGELLGTYSRVLVELRLRNLVRTNNAPIGDLAEYVAAGVYEGSSRQTLRSRTTWSRPATRRFRSKYA